MAADMGLKLFHWTVVTRGALSRFLFGEKQALKVACIQCNCSFYCFQANTKEWLKGFINLGK